MNKALIDDIISKEWNMFQKVNEGGPRASCQNDHETFDGMRRGQFMAWSDEALKSYNGDLLNAEFTGRNLVMEKYVNMMKYTNPVEYKSFEGMLTFPSETGIADAQYIANKMVQQTVALFENYPYVAGAGRPLYSSEDYLGTTSIETYEKGELLTYSDKTLAALRKHLAALESEGRSLAKEILGYSVMHYGYSSLEDAEEQTRRRMEAYYASMDSEGCGCGSCGCDDGGCDCDDGCGCSGCGC